MNNIETVESFEKAIKDYGYFLPDSFIGGLLNDFYYAVVDTDVNVVIASKNFIELISENGESIFKHRLNTFIDLDFNMLRDVTVDKEVSGKYEFNIKNNLDDGYSSNYFVPIKAAKVHYREDASFVAYAVAFKKRERFARILKIVKDDQTIL
jgi:hypothetical protein